jgi:hypothetical protein
MVTEKVLNESKIIDFNTIAVEGEEYIFLKNLFLNYHKRAYIYKTNYKIFKAVNMTINIFLSIVSSAAIVTAITVTPLVSILGVLTLITLGLQKGLKFDQRIDRSQLIFNMYNELLIKIKSYMRGSSYSKDELLTEINHMELFINDLAVIPLDICEKKYKKKYYK